ncbi:nitrite reductase (NAD(P)H) large subunit [Advenella kashmirensis WT001]|uniref:Nitrite reductase (NAD(P)H) large subunit n=1 Tax=Advenella kashmirensis (strain DSM 17095 / LMG 22695 / WT001) TaxID=1036672 RepID=I3U9I2_ADVKW|nr:nitrite reductase (NAD(P)H) large subunit [Advenella kashmirensis WT001]
MNTGNIMKKRKLVLIGNGMAGVRTIEELLKLDDQLYDITIIGSEAIPITTGFCCHPY